MTSYYERFFANTIEEIKGVLEHWVTGEPYKLTISKVLPYNCFRPTSLGFILVLLLYCGTKYYKSCL